MYTSSSEQNRFPAARCDMPAHFACTENGHNYVAMAAFAIAFFINLCFFRLFDVFLVIIVGNRKQAASVREV